MKSLGWLKSKDQIKRLQYLVMLLEDENANLTKEVVMLKKKLAPTSPKRVVTKTTRSIKKA